MSSEHGRAPKGFGDLLQANADYAAHFDLHGFDGVANAGVAMVTCMDSRIDPLTMIGLRAGDAKILRNPGGRVTDAILAGVVLAVNLLGVDRVLVVQHTRCAVASASEEEFHRRLTESTGIDSSWMTVPVVTDPERTLRDDVTRVRTHPLVPAGVQTGGFVYDVDTGRLNQLV
ncbi:beta-class carbonic anhydrase [Naumannella halotolerans]|uniref:carbonic anhydrase n=1 Tax=Naumannella halotolerans TaxID=993414 RepID=A0A4R7J5E2_9ACTN|nr:carbonic anhydrase [Naumannella halotolerans]TDT32560.1 carbonic anhydrase [Naumannella halotolerans]